MSELEIIRGLDLYLFDQLQKGRIQKTSKVLDAGCGSCRNMLPLYRLGYNIQGFDPNVETITNIQNQIPELKESLSIFSIEEYPKKNKFDFVICNAVLHFASSHQQFDEMINGLYNLLLPNGILFIRMTSDFASNPQFKTDSDGIAYLPDNTYRFLLTRNKLNEFTNKFSFKFIEPIKTTNVQDLRCMTTLVLQRSSS